MSALLPFEITKFTKTAGGNLGKILGLDATGALLSNPDGQRMWEGFAERAPITGPTDLAALLESCTPYNALALGSLRADLPDPASVGTRDRLNGGIARTQEYVGWRGGPGLALLDYDRKAMPATVAATVAALGGMWGALVAAVPGLATAARVSRASTSSGLYCPSTGDEYPAGGEHHFLWLTDTSNLPGFLQALADRCWLHGLGWHYLSARGAMLPRTVIDTAVGTPERFVFEGPPLVCEPLYQDVSQRRPVIHPGVAIDPLAVMPPLTDVERAKLDALKRESRASYQAEADQIRAAFNTRIATEISSRRGVPMVEALKLAELRHTNVLNPYDELVFVKHGLVLGEDVLANPKAFEGEYLADPDEGTGYGRNKAVVLPVSSGEVRIKSWAHGGLGYVLRPWDFVGFEHIKISPPRTDPPRDAPPTRIDGNFWLHRTLTAPIALLGDFITSSTRGFWGGPTGAEKTMICMAAGMAMACGRGFLHWAPPPRPLRVIYVDGEMPRDLMQERIRDMHRRMGHPDLANFHCLSREDFEEMPPLNKPEGRAFLIDWVARIDPDFIFLDSRMALLDGDMKDEEVWRETMPFVLWLTKRRIAHIWLDHTGHALDRIYGSKVKEWTADLVVLLEDLEAERIRLGAGVCVRLTFTKARRRNPAKNGADFASGVIALVGDTWTWTPDVNKPAGKVPDWCRPYYAALLTVLGTGNNITVPTWRDECERKNYIEPAEDGETASQRSKRFSKFRAVKSELARLGVISVVDDNFVFCAKTAQ